MSERPRAIEVTLLPEDSALMDKEFAELEADGQAMWHALVDLRFNHDLILWDEYTQTEMSLERAAALLCAYLPHRARVVVDDG